MLRVNLYSREIFLAHREDFHGSVQLDRCPPRLVDVKPSSHALQSFGDFGINFANCKGAKGTETNVGKDACKCFSRRQRYQN
jgi:hypothetical protein